MSSVSYGGYRIIPAPFVQYVKETQRKENGEIIGSRFVITVTGTLVAFKGSPRSLVDSGMSPTGWGGYNAQFWNTSGYPADETVTDSQHLRSIIRKQEALRYLFKTDGLSFEVQSADGSAPLKCNPRILSIEFASGAWYQRCEYTITMEADVIYVNGTALGEDQFNQYISGTSEVWALETNEDQPEGINQPRTYRLTHSVSATGKRFFNDSGNLVKEPWQHAKDYVLTKLGFDSTMLLSSGVNNLPTYYGGFNHVRSENTNKDGGTFSVDEAWIISSGSALEDFTISQRTDAGDGLTKVSIEGNVIGLEQRNSSMLVTTSKYENAVIKFTQVQGLLLSRAQAYTGITLNTLPLSTTIGRSPVGGNINYSYEYDNRPSNLIAGAKSEVIVIQDNLGGDLFAAIPVPGRAAGPILQDLNSRTPRTRSLSLELVMSPATFAGSGMSDLINAFTTQKPSVASPTREQILNIIAAANPENNAAVYTFENTQTENWQPKDGRYSYNIDWTYEL